MRSKERYKLNKQATVGEQLICPSCNTEFKKTNYQQAFCKAKPKTVCKDKYWNTVDPKKGNNTTRISPASERWLNAQAFERGYPDHKTFKEAMSVPEDAVVDGLVANVEVAKCEFCGLRCEYCECGDL